VPDPEEEMFPNTRGIHCPQPVRIPLCYALTPTHALRDDGVEVMATERSRPPFWRERRGSNPRPLA